ncbi:tetratricopeptide repeat protein [Streptomyces chartreusis]|uniref:tetratricopeptide repeat protein n=1 Tax=Streptomyces chartreusis TaxID=1969 RepID=UPI0037FD305B
MRWPFTRKPQAAHAGNPSVSAGATASGERAIAISTQGGAFLGVANTGDNTTIVHVPPEELRPPAQVEAPPGLVNLPVRLAAFVGRNRELALLDTTLGCEGAAVVQALHGLGGIGKSALAARWAATRASSDNPVWWITADTPTALDTGLAALAASLQPALAQLPPDQLRERAVQWLATHQGWLLVLDNVTNPAYVQPLLARAPTGRILITSRRASGWHNIATPIPLNALTPAESQAFLSCILTRGGSDPSATFDGSAELCAELGYLPLAIEQAGSYIAETGISPHAYLRLLADDPTNMYHQTGEGHDSSRTISRIWHVTLNHLTDTPLAGQILRILAWYAPDAIPRSLLTPLGAAPAVQKAVGRLAAYSMITTTGGALNVHRLVQAIARTPDPIAPQGQPHDIVAAFHQASTCLYEALPANANEPGDWPAWHTLLPHLDALTEHAPPETDTTATSTALNLAGVFVWNQGQTQRAIAYLRRAVAISRLLLGENHPDTLKFRSNLASAYQAAGDLIRAIPLHEESLKATARVLGKNHPDTLNSRNNLAMAYREAGDLSRAIPLHEENLDATVRVLGEEDPHTLTAYNNLAIAYDAAGDLHRAIPMFEHSLDTMVRVLGEDHRYTFEARHTLAMAYHAAGDPGRAIPLHEQALKDRVRVLGENHPNTLQSRNNLAHAYQAAGDLSRAIPIFEQTLVTMVRVMGEEHTYTLAARNNLASTYQEAGDLHRAIPLHEETVNATARVLGENHLDTLIYRYNLAHAYQAAGDLSRAISMFDQTLKGRVRVLGEDHPDTRVVASALAAALEERDISGGRS